MNSTAAAAVAADTSSVMPEITSVTSALLSTSTESMPAPFSPLPSPSRRSTFYRLISSYSTRLPFLSSSPSSALPVMRVNQLDAQQLDTELSHMLLSQMRRIFLHFHPRLLLDYKAELELLLALLVYAFTVHVGEPTPGAKLQNLVLSAANIDPSAAFHRLMHATTTTSTAAATSSTSATTNLSNPLSLLASSDAFSPQPLTLAQKWAYLVLTAILPYLHAKFTLHMTLHAWFASESPVLRAVYRMASMSQVVLSVLSTVNFLLFLVQGRYPSLVLRLLRVRLVYLRSRVSRQLSFDYMHQQLAFSVLTDFLTFALPFLPWRLFRSAYHYILDFLFPHRKTEPALSSAVGADAEADVCGVCGRSERLNASVVLPCLHVYCWYCCAAHMAEEAVWRCVVCDVIVSGVERWSEEQEAERREKRLAEQGEGRERSSARRSVDG